MRMSRRAPVTLLRASPVTLIGLPAALPTGVLTRFRPRAPAAGPDEGPRLAEVCHAFSVSCPPSRPPVVHPWQAAPSTAPGSSSEHTPDFRDPGRFRQFPAWKDLKDQDLAIAVWKYLTDPATGTYHFTDMYELSHEPHWEVKLIQDPMRILNVYGFAVCNMHSSMTCGLFKGMGFEQVRLAGWEQYHATPEIFWGGSWHYLDIDERAVHPR